VKYTQKKKKELTLSRTGILHSNNLISQRFGPKVADGRPLNLSGTAKSKSGMGRGVETM